MDQDNAIDDIHLKISADGPQFLITIEAPTGVGTAPFDLADPLSASLREFRWPQSFESLGTTRVLKARRTEVNGVPAAAAIGEGLFRALFPQDLRRLLDGNSASLRRLRLGWDPQEPRLAWLQNLPWELLRDPATGIFLVFDQKYSLLRQLPTEVREPPPPRTSRLVILGFGPAPSDQSPLQLKQEWAALRRLQAEETGLVFHRPDKGEILDPQTLRRYLDEKGAHILHFMGHGTVDAEDRGHLCFENEAGKAKNFSGEDLAQTLRGLPCLRLVFLNACHSAFTHLRPFSGVATALIRGGAPAVLAMQSAITDGAARLFSGELYRQLAAGRSLDRAVREARLAVHGRDPEGLEWALPALFVHSTGEPLADADRVAMLAMRPSREVAELLRPYLSNLVEANRFVDLTWHETAGPKPRLELSAIFALFQPDRRPFSERLRRAEDVARERERLERDFEFQGSDPGQKEVQLWQALRRLARGEREVFEAPDDDQASLLSFDQLARLSSRLVILGESGSGKTHLLRWLARQHAEASIAGKKRVRLAARRVDGRRDEEELLDLGLTRIPILFELQKCFDSRSRYSGHLLDAMVIPPGQASREQLRLRLEREITAGHVLLLFDGLDQIADPVARQNVVQEIEILVKTRLPMRDAAQVVVVSRAAGYDQAAFGPEFSHCRLEPMGSRTRKAFCRTLAAAVGQPDEALVDAATELLSRGEPDWAATPLMLTLLAAILARGFGRLPTRRIDLYEPAVILLLERWHELHDAEEESAFPDDRVFFQLLAELAAELQRHPDSCGLIEKSRLIGWIGQRLENFSQSAVERWLDRDLGPLSSFGGSLLGFLHRALQTYLAANWLASAPGLVEERLRVYSRDPLWRESVAMALGLRAEVLDREEFGRLARRLGLGPGADAADPALDLLGLALLPELPETHDLWTESFLVDLLERAAVAEEAWAAVVERLFLTFHGRSRVAVRALAHLIEKARSRGDRALAAIAARIVLVLPTIPVELADLFQPIEPLDNEPWPIEQCLRRLAEHDPTLLAGSSLSPRRLLRRDPALAGRIAKHPGWRLLLLALYGFRPGALPPFRTSPLDELIARALQNFSEPAVLIQDLALLAADPAHAGRGDAAVALFVLGQNLPGGRESWVRELERLRIRFDPPEAAEDLLLRLGERSANAPDRALLLGLYWRRLFFFDPDPRFRLAVLLDTRGGELSQFLPVLAASFVAAATGRAVGLDGLGRPDLLACLDALLAIPAAFDFVAGWALAVLRSLFESRELGAAAVLAAELLSNRFSARADTRRRLTGAASSSGNLDELRQRVDALEDSAFRDRARSRLGTADPYSEPSGSEETMLEVLWRSALALGLDQDEDPALLSLLLGPARPLQQRVHAPLDLERVEFLVANLAAAEDRQRLEATFELSGDHRPWRQNRSARAIGLEPLLRLGRHWLDLQLQDPRRALVVRWCLQGVEHDAPELLFRLSELAGGVGPEAESAEALLLHVEEVDREKVFVLTEILRTAPVRSRKALVRALPNGLSLGGRPAAAIWDAVGAELPRLAEIFGEELAPVEDPLALIEAAEVARAESPKGEPAAVVVRARELFRERGRRWSNLLKAEPAELRRFLERIGQRRRIAAPKRALDPAVEKLCGQPELIPVLVGWVEASLAAEGQRRSLDDREVSDLLGILAATAGRLPETLYTVIAARPFWRRRLCEAAAFFDWLPARRDAIFLLGMGRTLGRYELQALSAAMLDLPLVQHEAIASIVRYRRLESLSALEDLAEGLRSPSPSRAYAAGRLLATLGRPGIGDSALWRRCREILFAASAESGKRVYVPTGDGRMTGMRCLGSLDQILQRLKLQLEGIPCEIDVP